MDKIFKPWEEDWHDTPVPTSQFQTTCVCVTCHDWEGDDFFCPSVFFPLGEAQQLWNLGRRKRGKVVQYFVHLIKGVCLFFFQRAKNAAPVGMVKKETRTILKSSSWLREFVQVLSCWLAFVFTSMSCSTQWWTSLQCGGHLALCQYLGDAIFLHPTPGSIKTNEMIRAMLVGDCIAKSQRRASHSQFNDSTSPL